MSKASDLIRQKQGDVGIKQEQQLLEDVIRDCDLAIHDTMKNLSDDNI